jgi:hypothetical protein
LADTPDAEFGANTRAAIKKFQQANGYREAAFLTAAQHQALLASAQVASPAQTQAAQPPERLVEAAKPAAPPFTSQLTLAQYVQQGPKLVGSSGIGHTNQGKSVALSADGNTAIVGGPNDNLGPGAAWVFSRTGGVWTQQGPKLVSSGARGLAESVALSADGNTAIVSGWSGDGGAWVFTRTGGVWTAGLQIGWFGRCWKSLAGLQCRALC